MSQLLATMRERMIAPVTPTNGQPALTLADLKPGQTCRIVDVRDDAPTTTRRLVDLGFAPGAEVVVVRRAPMADPVVFRVAGCELALRRRQASSIHVQLST